MAFSHSLISKFLFVYAIYYLFLYIDKLAGSDDDELPVLRHAIIQSVTPLSCRLQNTA